MREIDLHSLPIDPLHVCEELNILVIPFSETKNDGFFEAIGIDLIDDLDGFCYKGEGANYIIFYDDARTPKERVNFTIAHELGHIILGHLENMTTRPRYMTNRQNDPREKEADAFAGELIRPPIPFVLAGCMRADDIQPVCNITREAAAVCAKLVRTMQQKRNNPYFFNEFQFYHEQFFDFIYVKYCGLCRYVFIDASAKFCPICGSGHLRWYNDRLPVFVLVSGTTEGDLTMRYREYATNDNGQLSRCIRCDNEAISPEDQYCRICKAPLYNRCVGAYVEDLYDGSQAQLDRNQSCGKLLPTNARYCTACGGISSFYHEGLLSHWQDESRALSEMQKPLMSAVSLEPPEPPELPEPPDIIPF